MEFENKKGITLVALVITVVILLILAGVAISALTQTGLFDKAKQAKNVTENAQKEENLILADYNNKIDDYIYNSRDTNMKTQILWENPKDSTENFDPQTITLANDEYDYIDIIFRFLTTEPVFLTEKVYKGYHFELIAGSGYSNRVAQRYGKFVNNKTINFEKAYWANSTPNNSACIPVKIIGYKILNQ